MAMDKDFTRKKLKVNYRIAAHFKVSIDKKVMHPALIHLLIF